MDGKRPGGHSPPGGRERVVSTIRIWHRLRSFTGHGTITFSMDSIVCIGVLFVRINCAGSLEGKHQATVGVILADKPASVVV